jgi:excinuclease ABC subunit B
MGSFRLTSDMRPAGDQPEAIRTLEKSLREGRGHQILLGVTGSGKTFTMANVIAAWGRPALVISHNKTLAAQLYAEFRDFFPDNAVEYFVSYYDYYQPEAYIPQRDIYIEKDAQINEEIDRLRLAATSALMARRDVVIVASVSCIYGLGSPDEYQNMMARVAVGGETDRDALLRKLLDIRYERSDLDFRRGTFRVRGDVVEIFPAYEETALRVEMFGPEVERIRQIHPLTGAVLRELQEAVVYPAKHHVAPDETIAAAARSIGVELEERLHELHAAGKLLEAQRLEARTRYDIEMLLELGYCQGIENYSRHLTGRTPGQPPYTLLDYFPDDFLTIVDESHVSIPQIGGMHEGDRSRKTTLVEHGFRLPSALDNRPLRFEEWEARVGPVLYASATPGPYELKKCHGEIVEQLIRPTGLVDPQVEVRPSEGQVDDLVAEIQARIERKERTLVTTLTKRLAERLSEHFAAEGIRCNYLHSEVKTVERVEILRDLRAGTFDVVVGVNLLREGLDLPEVSLVAILDADKEGFLRSQTSLIQTIGRSARNVNARVILYADRITDSMRKAMDETARRREAQLAFNREHGIQPETVRKAIRAGIEAEVQANRLVREMVHENEAQYVTREALAELEAEMKAAAAELDFERAAELRDRIRELTGEDPRGAR